MTCYIEPASQPARDKSAVRAARLRSRRTSCCAVMSFLPAITLRILRGWPCHVQQPRQRWRLPFAVFPTPLNRTASFPLLTYMTLIVEPLHRPEPLNATPAHPASPSQHAATPTVAASVAASSGASEAALSKHEVQQPRKLLGDMLTTCLESRQAGLKIDEGLGVVAFRAAGVTLRDTGKGPGAPAGAKEVDPVVIFVAV
jgi:hypothetical protein